MPDQAPLIVGAGPAGAAAAITLARAGARPTILERNRETGDALCGGFLSWHTLRNLEKLGVDGLEGHPIRQVRLLAGKRSVTARLPELAIGVSRRRLDTVMQRVAEAAGAHIERGVTVRGFDNGSLRTDSDTLTPRALFLATGKHELRGLARPRGDGDATLGLRVRLAAHPALRTMLAHIIELHLFDRGYAGLQLQEDGSANLCMAVRKSRLAEAGGDPVILLRQLGVALPILGERLAFMAADPSVDAIASVPYGWRAMGTTPGIFRLGDQAAVIPSLAGEGVGIAIASGMSAANAWTAGGGDAAPAWQRDFASRARRPIALARTLWAGGEHPWSAGLALNLIAQAPALARLAARATRIGD